MDDSTRPDWLDAWTQDYPELLQPDTQPRRDAGWRTNKYRQQRSRASLRGETGPHCDKRGKGGGVRTGESPYIESATDEQLAMALFRVTDPRVPDELPGGEYQPGIVGRWNLCIALEEFLDQLAAERARAAERRAEAAPDPDARNEIGQFISR